MRLTAILLAVLFSGPVALAQNGVTRPGGDHAYVASGRPMWGHAHPVTTSLTTFAEGVGAATDCAGDCRGKANPAKLIPWGAQVVITCEEWTEVYVGMADVADLTVTAGEANGGDVTDAHGTDSIGAWMLIPPGLPWSFVVDRKLFAQSTAVARRTGVCDTNARPCYESNDCWTVGDTCSTGSFSSIEGAYLYLIAWETAGGCGVWVDE